MDIISFFLNFILHIDTHLISFIDMFGVWSYGILFLIVFCETGLVVTPFLPGDSLLFAAGAFAALNSFHIGILFAVLCIAAIVGDSVNYIIGHYLGEKVFTEKSRFFKKEYLEKTQKFYEKHGGITIILARFIPIIRTFAPFLAGVGTMSYGEFLLYNIVGGILWVSLFVFGGYFFGNFPIVKDNFSLAILLIIVLSVAPIVVEFLKKKLLKHA